jgi:hypothetical protein
MKLRFSLKTLFVVVTLAAVGAGWAVHSRRWIAERDAKLKMPAIYGNQSIPPLFSKPVAPGCLWLFGERGQHTLRVNTSMLSKAEVVEIRELFPESILWLRSGMARQPGDADLAPGEYPK